MKKNYKEIFKIDEESFNKWRNEHWIRYASTQNRHNSLQFYVNLNNTYKIEVDHVICHMSNDFDKAKEEWNQLLEK